MATCLSCGTQNQAAAWYCNSCGVLLPIDEPGLPAHHHHLNAPPGSPYEDQPRFRRRGRVEQTATLIPRWVFYVLASCIVLLAAGLGIALVLMTESGDTLADVTPTQSAVAEAEATPELPVQEGAIAEPTAPELSVEVQLSVEEALDSLPGIASAAFISGSTSVYRDAHQLVPMGSLIKIVIAAEAMRQMETGQLDLQERLEVRPNDVVGGTGILQGRVGTSHTLNELVEIMLLHSDNTAGNMLIDRLGGFSPINAFAVEIGMPNTHLNRKFMDTAAQARGVENYSTAEDISTFLVKLNWGDVVNPDVSGYLMNVLAERGRFDREWLLADVPTSVMVAHATGILSGIRNDVVFVKTNSGPYILVVFVQHADESVAEQAIRRVGRDVYDAVNIH